MKKNRSRNTIKDYPEFKGFLKAMEDMDIPLDAESIPHSRDVMWDGEPCIICGGRKLIHGVGRYYITHIDEDKICQPIKICGYCINLLTERWGINLDFE